MHWSNWEIKTKTITKKYLPKRLFYRGNWDEKVFENVLAIVGSRRMTRYGKEVVEKFVPELVARNITIISGFMYGVDAEAHKKCIEYGGKTIAVLGGGLNYLFPAENDELYTKILDSGGLVISEYEPEFCPTLWTFPQRNRIVAALANKGVLVVEAGLKSGSLITAKLGKKYGRKIFAVPGSIFNSVSAGTNWLIAENWAKTTLSTEQILGGKQVVSQSDLFVDGLSETEVKILNLLKGEELSADEMGRKLGLKIMEVTIGLSGISMKGLVDEELGKYYLIK